MSQLMSTQTLSQLTKQTLSRLPGTAISTSPSCGIFSIWPARRAGRSSPCTPQGGRRRMPGLRQAVHSRGAGAPPFCAAGPAPSKACSWTGLACSTTPHDKLHHEVHMRHLLSIAHHSTLCMPQVPSAVVSSAAQCWAEAGLYLLQVTMCKSSDNGHTTALSLHQPSVHLPP